MMTPIAGDERHFHSFWARQDYIPGVGLDLTEQQREMGNKDHKTCFQSPSCHQKSCRVKRCSCPLSLTQALFASVALPRQGLLQVYFLLPLSSLHTSSLPLKSFQLEGWNSTSIVVSGQPLPVPPLSRWPMMAQKRPSHPPPRVEAAAMGWPCPPRPRQ